MHVHAQRPMPAVRFAGNKSKVTLDASELKSLIAPKLKNLDQLIQLGQYDLSAKQDGQIQWGKGDGSTRRGKDQTQLTVTVTPSPHHSGTIQKITLTVQNNVNLLKTCYNTSGTGSTQETLTIETHDKTYQYHDQRNVALTEQPDAVKLIAELGKAKVKADAEAARPRTATEIRTQSINDDLQL